jgi:hypothetical protein
VVLVGRRVVDAALAVGKVETLTKPDASDDSLENLGAAPCGRRDPTPTTSESEAWKSDA